MTIQHRTYSSVRWTAGGSIFRVLLALAQLAVLARLLRPEDYGLMAMVTLVLGLVAQFADLGFGQAYVQRQEVDDHERSSLFWANVFMGCVLTLLLFWASPFVAGLLGDARLTPLLQLASVMLAINALGQQLRKQAEKQLRFRRLVLTEIGAAVAGFLAAVLAALADWGVHALVAGAIVTSLTACLLAWLVLAEGWRPKACWRWADIRGYLVFGGSVVINDLVNEVNRSIDILLGGRVLSAAALGLYSVPRQMVLQLQGVVNPIITRVGFPLIAQIQDQEQRVRSIYLKTVGMTAAVNAPLYIGLAAFATPLIDTVFGPQWDGAAPLLSLLALWAYLRSTGNPVGSLLLGMGRADLSLKWNLVQLLLLPPILWTGSHWGAEGLAGALLVHAALMFLPGWFFLVRPLCRAGLAAYVLAALRPALLSVIAVLPSAWLSQAPAAGVLHLGLAAAVFGAAYLGLSVLFNRDWVVAMRRLFAGQ